MRASAFFLALIGTTQMVWAACDDTLPASGSRNDVLVIVNDNAVDSCEVGRYYAQKRQLGRSNIVHIKVPANPTISYSQYEIYRNQIIRALQQNMAANGTQPINCSNTTQIWCSEVVSQLTTYSPIKYLVVTKGVPARVTNNSDANWVYNGENSAGSIDGYLRNQLGNFLYPARVDGLDLASAKRLLDRAMDIEKSGWFGNLISAATKNDFGNGPGNSRFAKSDYHPITTTKVHSEELAAPYSGDTNGLFSDGIAGYPLEGYHHWRYQFGLFSETDLDCTGNTSSGSSTNFYLNNSPSTTTGKAPEKCKVKLEKGNGANPAYGEIPAGNSTSRIPTPINAIVYLGHLDGQPSLGSSSNFNAIKNWKKSSQCTAQLCKDASDAAACRAASTDIYQELDTRCVGVADGFIGHNFQSWPLSYFTSWPTGWHPLSRSNSATNSEIGGGDSFIAYPLVRTDTGDGDSNSVWFAAHDKSGTTQCLQSDLATTTSCQDLNRIVIGQAISTNATISASKYYRVSLSYRSLPGETAVTDSLRATVAVKDANSGEVQLFWVDTSTSPWTVKTNTDGLVRDASNNNATLGNDSSGWKKVSGIFKLDASLLSGQTKQISAISLVVFNNSNFSGSVGLDNIKLEEVNSSGNTVQTLPIANSDFQGGHNQFAVGDWAATFTSRLNGAAFWGSTGHNGGGTSIFRTLADTLNNFIGGDPLAKAVWRNEGGPGLTSSGGLLYGDPLYSPINVNIRPNVGAASETTLKAGQLPIIIDAVNGTDSSKVSTQYRVDVCHASTTNAYADFYVCDRENSWVSTGISGSSGGKNIQTTLNASQYAQIVHTLRVVVTSTQLASGQSQTYQHFFTFFGIGRFLSSTGIYDTDGDGLNDETEIYSYQLNPASIDSNNDGVIDSDEVSNSSSTDTDGDGLSDYNETHFYHTDPNKWDSDGDGRSDKWEIQDHTDPLDKTKFKVRLIPAILWQRMVD